MLAQWMCRGRIIFEDSPPDKAITSAIEFARFADMCCVTDMESLMAEHIKDIIIADAALRHGKYQRNHIANTYSITS